jgi:DNA-binding NarL/FixJ family response regulator
LRKKPVIDFFAGYTMKKRKLNILIVDDNKGYTERMTSLLNDTQNVSNIHTAYNVEEATDLLTGEHDLILLDINLAGQNGIALLKQIRDSGNNCEVIMMTNYTGEYYREECKKLGASFFLDKSNDFELLPGILDTMRN